MPTPDEATDLQLPKGAPLLRILRTATDPAGAVVEVNDTRMSAAKFEIGYPLTPSPPHPPPHRRTAKQLTARRPALCNRCQ
ncbi:UTRA domain-containing protein [Kitasatospora aureofaciens]|nr:UTRA domain-containing protein [Kitasatospora aureofaciens]